MKSWSCGRGPARSSTGAETARTEIRDHAKRTWEAPIDAGIGVITY